MENEYSSIKSIKVTNSVLQSTRLWLYEAGKNYNEAFVLWAGAQITSDVFLVATAIYPEQHCLHSTNGLAVYVTGDELFNINKWLFENNLVLIAQVHSHPTEAYHSSTDDNFPMVNTQGQYSIVIPYFSKDPEINLSRCAIYRLNHNNAWIKSKNIFEVI